ncbi:MAG: hypothetical protein ABIS06_03820, partial [Vicinamibacterales bacterium]
MRKERLDAAVLDAIGGGALRPAVVSAVLDGVFDALKPEALGQSLDVDRAEPLTVGREIDRLVNALAFG